MTSDERLKTGIRHQQAGRLAEAEQVCREILQASPNDPNALHLLGVLAGQRGQTDEAIAAYRQAILVKPDFAAAYFNLGQTLSGAGRLAESLPAFAGALRAKPDYVEVHVRMAIVLAQLQRFDEARAAQARAAELAPHSAGPLEALGEIMLREHRAADAAEQFRKALEIDPKQYTALNSLGNALLSQGKFEEAATCFRQFVEQCPESELGMGYVNLASTGRVAADQKEQQRLMAVLGEPNSPADNRVAAGFALGKFFDDSGRFDEAFACYTQANALWKQIRAGAGDRYRPELIRRNIDHLIAQFDRNFFETRRDYGEPSELPVFIVGMPRSGSTLVHQIAASHPQVHGLGEGTDVYQIAKALKQNDPASRSNVEAVRAAAKEHVQQLRAINGEASRIIDKTLSNVHWLGLISLLFPGARVICCRREARDTCLSCYFQWFSQGNTFSFDLAHCGTEYLQINRLMDHWLGSLPIRMLEVQYETLVADLEGQSRRLIDFLGLPWHPGCIEFHRAKTTVLTPSMWQVRQPIYQSSVGRWRHYQRHLGPLMEVLTNGTGT
ncbi:MAG: sulfotransferase [Tepidisphaeraceae bacterium]